MIGPVEYITLNAILRGATDPDEARLLEGFRLARDRSFPIPAVGDTFTLYQFERTPDDGPFPGSEVHYRSGPLRNESVTARYRVVSREFMYADYVEVQHSDWPDRGRVYQMVDVTLTVEPLENSAAPAE